MSNIWIKNSNTHTYTQSFANMKQTMANTWPNEAELGRKSKKTERRICILKDVGNATLTSLDCKDGEISCTLVTLFIIAEKLFIQNKSTEWFVVVELCLLQTFFVPSKITANILVLVVPVFYCAPHWSWQWHLFTTHIYFVFQQMPRER